MNRTAVGMFLALLVCLGLAVGHTVAQDGDDPPIIVFNEGDLWMWNGSSNGMQQMTFWGYNQQPVLSPDGNYLAYMAWAQVTVDALAREGGIAGGELPSDIKIMNIETGEEIVVAGQPEDAAFFTPDVPDKAVVRSRPVWSPEGDMLAWTEFDYSGEGVNRAIAYDLAKGKVAILVNELPSQAGVPIPMDVAWGETGLILQSFTMVEQTDIFESSFLVYDPAGVDELVASIPVPEAADRFLMGFVLVAYEDREYIGAGYNTGEWDLFDPLTGESLPAPGVPEMYSPSAPDESLSFALVASGNTGIRYQLLGADGLPIGEPFDMGFDAINHMSVAPDGQSVAYMPYNPQTAAYHSWVMLVKDGGEQNSVELNPYGTTFVWGPVAWRIRPLKE